ncbi:hypothetical protein ACN47E_008219 [Coniothyrium glycines]
MNHLDNSFDSSLLQDPFAAGLLQEMTSDPKILITPLMLEKDLMTLLRHLLYTCSQHHNAKYHKPGADVLDEEVVLGAALAESYDPVKDFKEYWEMIIGKWV